MKRCRFGPFDGRYGPWLTRDFFKFGRYHIATAQPVKIKVMQFTVMSYPIDSTEGKGRASNITFVSQSLGKPLDEGRLSATQITPKLQNRPVRQQFGDSLAKSRGCVGRGGRGDVSHVETHR